MYSVQYLWPNQQTTCLRFYTYNRFENFFAREFIPMFFAHLISIYTCWPCYLLCVQDLNFSWQLHYYIGKVFSVLILPLIWKMYMPLIWRLGLNANYICELWKWTVVWLLAHPAILEESLPDNEQISWYGTEETVCLTVTKCIST